MRNWICFALLLFGVAAAGCHRKGLSTEDPGSGGTGVGILGVGGNGGQGVTGVGGAGGAGGIPAACSGASDERVVVADQRILRLTVNETLNTIRYLIDATEAATVADMGFVSGDDSPLYRRFP